MSQLKCIHLCHFLSVLFVQPINYMGEDCLLKGWHGPEGSLLSAHHVAFTPMVWNCSLQLAWCIRQMKMEKAGLQKFYTPDPIWKSFSDIIGRLFFKQWRPEHPWMPHCLCLPVRKCPRNTSVSLMYVCMGGRLRGRMNEAVFANNCEKQKRFFVALILLFYFLYLYFYILLFYFL